MLSALPSGEGNSAPDNYCDPGYYCPGGQTSKDPVGLQCPEGHYCPAGAWEPIVCENGTYNGQTGEDECEICPAGFYCDPTESGPVITPASCPTGYYCPDGTGAAESQPCPPGTFGDTGGYEELSDCVACTAGYYCESPGLTAPTDECYAGYYCTGGAYSPTPYDDMVDPDNTTFTGNDVCPVGYFCSNGTAYPEPCPAGTFSTNTRVTNEEDCEPCPPGRYCNLQGFVKVSEAPKCSAGYICTGGSTTPTPESVSGMGYPCPAGFYCPSGAVTEIGCPIGTYQPNTGQANCTICPSGLMCPYGNMTAPLDCKTGYYCPYDESVPLPCPPGTFNNITGISLEEECSYCPSGQYCEGYGNSYPSGYCQAGYYCEGGADDKVPTSTSEYPTMVYVHSATIVSKVPLHQSNVLQDHRSNLGAASLDECDPCPGGFYCNTSGQVNATDECYAGFYCPANATVTTPAPLNYKCPVGHYCPEGSLAPVPCEVGYYQPNEGRSNSTRYPISCPNGTFTYANDTGLKSEYECLPCVSGKFCRGGEIQGDCAEGYFCLSTSYLYTPDGNFPDSNFDQGQCEPNTTCAGPCPAAHYCPEGTMDPIPCSNNTYRGVQFGSQEEDCMPCPAGFYCLEGDPILYDCPLGHYCLEGLAPMECPLYHYRDVVGAASAEDCFNCLPGYYCNETGMTNSTFYPCPTGHYCEEATTYPEPCTGGRMSPTEGRVSNEDCPLCDPGYFCPNDTLNVYGIPCDPSYECPEGASIEVTCRPGHYCEGTTGEPPICPGGYYCPLGSSSYTRCFYPKYCPEGSEVPSACPLGYKAVDHPDLRSTDLESCSICPAGTYGNHTERYTCSPCPEGYYCPEGTGDPEQNPCPIGFYCPPSSSSPEPCPVGQYGNLVKAVTADQCQLCPVNTFNDQTGQKACRPCGSSALSVEGQATCSCIGKYRSFQTTDGSCVCWSGYIFYNEVDLAESEGNSDGDCQPVVDIRCELNQARDANTRMCIDPASKDCTTSCGIEDGTYNVDLGRCECNQYTLPEELCDIQCQSTQPTVQGDLTESGQLVVTTMSSNGTAVSQEAVPNIIGPNVHTSGTKNIEICSFEDTGTVGHVITDPSDVEFLLLGTTTIQLTTESIFLTNDFTSSEPNTTSTFSRRRLLATSGDTLSGIPNPLFCLELEDMMIFRVSINEVNRSLSHYPVYVKDHLFNTNPTFDYSEFRDLRFYVESTNVSISSFAHVFVESGQYVFADTQEPEHEVIISVQEAGVSCDSQDFKVQPSSSSNLVEQKVSKHEPGNEEPDWGLIIGMLSFLAACVILLVIAVIVWRPKYAGIYPMKAWKPKYRALGAPPKIPGYLQYQDFDRGCRRCLHPCWSRAGQERDGSARGPQRSYLYDKLEDQTLYLSQQLAKQQEDLLGFYERMSQQTDGLKSLLVNLDAAKIEGLQRSGPRVEHDGLQGAASDGPNVVNVTSNRQYNFAGSRSREHELMEALQALLEKLNSGKIPISPEMLKRGKTSMTSGMSLVSGKGAAVDKLLARQNQERVKLEKDLRIEEEREMRTFCRWMPDKESQLLRISTTSSTKKLEKASTQEEVDRLITEHDKRVADTLEKLEGSKQRQMQDLLQRLAQKRNQSEAAMKRQHKQEAEEAGLTLEEDEDGDAFATLLEQGIALDLLFAEEASGKANALLNRTRNSEKNYSSRCLKISQMQCITDSAVCVLRQAFHHCVFFLFSICSFCLQDDLVNAGTLPGEAVDEMKREQFDMEAVLKKKNGQTPWRPNKVHEGQNGREKTQKRSEKLKDKHAKELEAPATEAGTNTENNEFDLSFAKNARPNLKSRKSRSKKVEFDRDHLT
ncbi:hypothetical protein BSL78_29274 [Apostichopus japonicus]|uniref:Uncharacterized protein n=1 Tax=Stichopus japonicus TaxID=307972 RepID=A0A2G8JDT2_STIJA|nr:hypothetical protein BSL78_29274 [Apostichopus japonicus]